MTPGAWVALALTLGVVAGAVNGCRRLLRRLEKLPAWGPAPDPAGKAFLEELEGSGPGPLRVAALNEHTRDLAAACEQAVLVPRASGRVALAFGAFASLLLVPGALTAEGGSLGASLPLATGAAGYLVVLELGRRARAEASRRREGWARWCRRLGGEPGA